MYISCDFVLYSGDGHTRHERCGLPDLDVARVLPRALGFCEGVDAHAQSVEYKRAAGHRLVRSPGIAAFQIGVPGGRHQDSM